MSELVKLKNGIYFNICHENSDRTAIDMWYYICMKEASEWWISFPFPTRLYKQFWILSRLQTELTYLRYSSNTPFFWLNLTKYKAWQKESSILWSNRKSQLFFQQYFEIVGNSNQCVVLGETRNNMKVTGLDNMTYVEEFPILFSWWFTEPHFQIEDGFSYAAKSATQHEYFLFFKFK